MKMIGIGTIFLTFLLFSCSSDKPDNIYPDSDDVSDSDADSDLETAIDDDTAAIDDNSEDTDETADISDTETDTDSEDDADSDEIEIITDPCTPNPCIMENSNGNCTVEGDIYSCGCNENYFWSDNDCVPDPCSTDPCKNIENATGKCGVDNGVFVCECDPSYYWKGSECIIIPDIVYVKADASGLDDGTSWNNAFTDFKDAMSSLGLPEEEKWVWVAKGVYKPKKDVTGMTCETSEKKHSFSLKNNVSVFGGFSGSETVISQRDWETNETIFSGDTDDSGTISECDVYHVFLNSMLDNSAVIDGVIIENGNANYTGGEVEDKDMRHGGGMNNWGEASPVIRNVTFRNNSAQVNGGGMSNSYESHPVIENCIFEHNESFKGGAFGAAYQSNPAIINSVFRNNTTREGYGGAIVAEGSNPYFYNCLFTENESEDGGTAAFFEESKAQFENCRFMENTANRNGGAISMAGFSNPEINSCLFDSNTAKEGGGAIEVYDGSEPVIVNSKFFRNKASGSIFSTGGAILVSDARPYFINSLFIANNASAGGAISSRKGTSVFLNCTIAYNSATGDLGFGGGIYNETSSAPEIINSIIWNNTAENFDPEISNDMSTPAISFSNIQGSFSDGVWDEGFGTDEGDNMNADPMFNDPDNGDLTLFTESPCINTGSNSPYEPDNFAETILKDLLGNDRIIDGVVDMGAYESESISE